ncbi:MAG TPA: c-type cytochrome biogenesis protein CcmI [Casimicrobiaceae bacterium]|nr:c-type cytochrome biogenesis protein CcmI [Casimicrobiaceae bacterium]
MPPAPLFWLVALLLAAASVTALVWPLLRNRAREAIADDAAATDVYRDQKRQLDEELAAGAITHAERDAQVDELATRLSHELDERVATTPAPPARSSYVAALILVGIIPVAALALYATFGSPAALRAEAGTAATAESKMSAEEIDELVGKLAARMKERPEDPKGWELLARTYAALGRFDESVAAYKEAAARGAPDASLYADWADAVAMRNQSLGGEASQLIAQALALDPNHPKALALAATAALQRKDYAGAIADWRKLKAQLPPQSDEAKSIDAMIAEADAAQRGEGKPSGEATPAASASVSAKAANGSPAENSAITGRVSLDPKLRDRVEAGETLFIYARPASGSRMPLAVLRLPASDLPHDFRLDDSLAMTPAAKLSTASEVIVEARISKTGSATPASGDLRGTSGPLAPGAHDVLIVINDVVR